LLHLEDVINQPAAGWVVILVIALLGGIGVGLWRSAPR
jgi:hypothetical protein